MRDLVKGRKQKLEDFMKHNKQNLLHHRAFYILEPVFENGAFYKFGVAGTNSGNAFNRLHDYVIMYGKFSPSNPNHGVYIHYCGITGYDRLVLVKNTQVSKLEKKLKDSLKKETAIDTKRDDRGEERVLASKFSIEDAIKWIKKEAPQNDVSETGEDTNRGDRKTRKTTDEKSKLHRNDRRAFTTNRTMLLRSQG